MTDSSSDTRSAGVSSTSKISPSSATLESVRNYYGKVLQSSSDLQTSACCLAEKLPANVAAIIEQIHPEVRARFYGCGLVTPPALEGCTVLDLGCGSGRDVFVLSKLVGERGRVIGVDMTDEQLAVAERHREWQAKEFGFRKSNVEFRKGFIEDLESIGIASNSVDLVVSNCVINLSPAKDRVFAEIMRVLKPGGEMYLSDVFADRRLPRSYMEDPVLLGECLGGAMYKEDFRRLMTKLGCQDVRCVSTSELAITSPDIQTKVGLARFFSMTVRAFKIDLEDKCEDYGQVAWYLGTIPGAPNAFRLDDHHLFETGRPMTVCSNTAAMIGDTRYRAHFRVDGNLETHHGLFPCGPSPVSTSAGMAGAAACSPAGGCC